MLEVYHRHCRARLALAVWNGTVYIGSWDRYFYALDACSGTLKWKFVTGDDRNIYESSRDSDPRRLLATWCTSAAAPESSTRWTRAADASSGSTDEHGSAGLSPRPPPTAIPSITITSVLEAAHGVLDARTGSLRFAVPYDAFAGPSPALANRHRVLRDICGAAVCRRHAVRAHRRAAVYRPTARRESLPAHLDANGNLDVSSFYSEFTLDGVFVDLERIYALGSIPGSPVVANGLLFIGSTDGTLYAIA